jgi:hypothetical protein
MPKQLLNPMNEGEVSQMVVPDWSSKPSTVRPNGGAITPALAMMASSC